MPLRGLIVALSVSLLGSPAEPQGQDERPATCVLAGRPARLGGCVPGAEAGGSSGRLFFRDSASRHWYFVDAPADGGCAWGAIPAPGTRLKGVAFYLVIDTAAGPQRTRERTVRVVRSREDCPGSRPLPVSSVEPAFVGATVGAPLAPRGFGAEAVRGGAPAWVLGSVAAAAAGGGAAALGGGGDGGGDAGAPRLPGSTHTAAATPSPEPTATPEPAPPRRPTPTPAPTEEPAREPAPPPPPAPGPTPRPAATPNPTETPKPEKPTETPKPTEAPQPTETPKPKKNSTDEDVTTFGSVPWRSELHAPGATGQILWPRGVAIEASAAPVSGALAVPAGENIVDIRLRGATGPGSWRLVLGGPGVVPGSLRVLAGEAVVDGAGSILVRVRGRPGEGAVIAFHAAPGVR